MKYIKDKKSGNILPIDNMNVMTELERNNQTLIKRGKAHEIEFEIVEPKHEIINLDEIDEIKIKKPGRKTAKK